MSAANAARSFSLLNFMCKVAFKFSYCACAGRLDRMMNKLSLEYHQLTVYNAHVYYSVWARGKKKRRREKDNTKETDKHALLFQQRK